MNPVTPKKSCSLLALGDSYTIGEAVLEDERFPIQTASLLKPENFFIDPVKIIAKTGWTTDELKAAILTEDIQQTYDLVTLLIGVNNQYRGREAEEYKAEFSELLEMALGFARDQPDHVYVLSIPDWGVTPFAAGRDATQIAAAIDQFNFINRQETLAAGAHYLDITDITRLSPHDPSLLAGDGLHPSGKMYSLWARRLADLIKKTY